MQRNTLIILAVLLTLITLGVATYMVTSKQMAVPAVSGGSDLRGKSLFTDGEYGFSIIYPDTFQTDYTFASFYHLPATWRVQALSSTTGTPVLAIISYRTEHDHTYPRYFDAEIRIGASQNPKELARCEHASLEQNEKVLNDVSFGTTTFKAFSFGDAAMMQYLRGVSYRTLHKGTCIAIEQIQTGSSYRDDPASSDDIRDATLQLKYHALDEVVKTFMFATP